MKRTCSDDESCIVSIQAQVMRRDDGYGGWTPMDGGGFSIIRLQWRKPLKKFSKNQDPLSEFNTCENSFDEKNFHCVITGEKLPDRISIMECAVTRDLHYETPTPTFHHWTVQECRYGLTFRTPSDAALFHNAVSRIVQDLAAADDEADGVNSLSNNFAGIRCTSPTMSADSRLSVEENLELSLPVITCSSPGATQVANHPKSLSLPSSPLSETLCTPLSDSQSCCSETASPPRPPKPAGLCSQTPQSTLQSTPPPPSDDKTEDIWVLREKLDAPPPLLPRQTPPSAEKSLRHSKPLPVPSEGSGQLAQRLMEYPYVDLVPQQRNTPKHTYNYPAVNHEHQQHAPPRRQTSATSVPESVFSSTSCTRLLALDPPPSREVVLPRKQTAARPRLCRRCLSRMPQERALRCSCFRRSGASYSYGGAVCSCNTQRSATQRAFDSLLGLLPCVCCDYRSRQSQRPARSKSLNVTTT